MNTAILTDKELISHTKYFVAEEAKCTLKILDLLRENRKRKLYAQLGYGSLFDFCVKELGFSHGETQRRLSSAQLLESVPEAEDIFKKGKISLTTLFQIQTHCNQQEKNLKVPLSSQEKRDLVLQMQGKTTRQVENELLQSWEKKAMGKAKISDAHKASNINPQLIRPQIKRVTSGEVRFSISLHSSTFEKLQQAKSYMTKTKDVSWDEFFDKMASAWIEKEFIVTKRKNKIQEKEKEKEKEKEQEQKHEDQTNRINQTSSKGKLPKHPTRYIPVAVKEEVWKRSGGRCEFISPQTGMRCSSHHRLQYAHIVAYAKGGKNTSENIFHLCFEHNAFEALREFPQQYNAILVSAGEM